MRNLLISIYSILPQLLLGQYTYFNNGYLPPYPEIGWGYSTNLLIRNDSLFTYSFSPFEINNGIQVYVIDQQGIQIEEYLNSTNDNILVTDYSDNISNFQSGYIWAGGNQQYPIIRWMNSHFDETLRVELVEILTDTTYGEFFNNTIAENGEIVCTGRKIYDLLPEQPGQDFANLTIAKFDSQGNELWFHEFDQEDLEITTSYSPFSAFPKGGIFELSTGELILFGSIGNDNDCYAFKFDSLGNYIDHVSWGHPTYSDGNAWPVQISENEFRFVYGTYSTGMGEEWLSHPRSGILNTDAMNVQLDTALDHDYIYGQITDFEPTPDGGFALLYYGEPNTNGEEFGFAWIIKLDSDGNEEWIQQYAPPEPYDTQTAYDLEITSDGGCAFVGNYHPYDQGVFYYKTWVVKTDACGDLIDAGCEPIIQISELQDKQETLSVYPNPVQDVLTISYENAGIAFLELYDATGRLVIQQKVNDQAVQHYINVGELPSSLYELRLINLSGATIESAVVVKK